MNIAILLLTGVGALVVIVGSILLLVAAFRVSLGWGLASLLVPFAGLVFIPVHWAEARRGFLVSLVGTLLLGGAAVLVTMNSQGKLETAMNLAFENAAVQPAITDPVAAQAADLEAVFEELKVRHAALETRRASLKLADPAAVETFNREATAYHRDLHQARAEKAALSDSAKVAGNAG